MLTTGNLLGHMWDMTVQQFPKLSVIDDDNYKHMILNCSTEEQQNNVLDMFLEMKEKEKQEKQDVCKKHEREEEEEEEDNVKINHKLSFCHVQ